MPFTMLEGKSEVLIFKSGPWVKTKEIIIYIQQTTEQYFKGNLKKIDYLPSMPHIWQINILCKIDNAFQGTGFVDNN